jgi:hypothetical protein
MVTVFCARAVMDSVNKTAMIGAAWKDRGLRFILVFLL